MSIRKTIFAFGLVSVVLILGIKALLFNLSPLFSQVDKMLANNSTIVMNGELDSVKFSKLLIDGKYITDAKDAQFIGRWYKEKIEAGEPLENLGAINGDRFKIPIDTVRKYGGPELNARVDAELIAMGQDSIWHTIDRVKLQSTYGKQSSDTQLIQVFVGRKNEKKKFGIIPSENLPVQGVIVRLTEHWINDSVPSTDLPVSHELQTLGYTVTDADGIAKFYVPRGKNYSVIPIAEGYQYGMEKGTVNGPLLEDLDKLNFTQSEHSIRPFRTATYQLLKADKVLISRTPGEFKSKAKSGLTIFLISWALVFVAIKMSDKRINRQTDIIIPLCLMILSYNFH